MKLYSFEEVQSLRNDVAQGWSERAIEDGFIFIPQINRFVKPEPKEDYYAKGKTMDDFYISSSSLQYINPEEGGSPMAFVDFIENGIEETKNMKLGTLLHRYHEDRDSFAVSNTLKPSEKAGEVADKIIEIVRAGGIYCNETVMAAINEIGYQSNWKPETRLNKILELCNDYVSEVLEAQDNNQIYLTASQLEPIQKGSEAIDNHPVASQIAFFSNNDISGTVCFKEIEIERTLNYKYNRNDVVPLRLKSKIDNIIIDTERKIIIITDLKSSLGGGFHYGQSTVYQRKHFRQLAFYYKMVRYWLKSNNFDDSEYEYQFKIISQQTSGLYQCVVYDIDPRNINRGEAEVSAIIDRIAFHELNNNWKYSREELMNNYQVRIDYVEDNQG